jgi:hypothetical protein
MCAFWVHNGCNHGAQMCLGTTLFFFFLGKIWIGLRVDNEKRNVAVLFVLPAFKTMANVATSNIVPHGHLGWSENLFIIDWVVIFAYSLPLVTICKKITYIQIIGALFSSQCSQWQLEPKDNIPSMARNSQWECMN